MEKVKVRFKKLYDDVVVPSYGSEEACAFDLRAYFTDEKEREYGRMIHYETRGEMIPTGLVVGLPEGWELQVRPRSGLSAKTGLRISNSPGTVDSDYRGEICVLIDNIAGHTEMIKHGDRLCQAKLSPVYQADFVEDNSLNDTETKRGSGGFGSTGTD